MLFSNDFYKFADSVFSGFLNQSQNLRSEATENTSKVSGDEQALLKFLYGTLPVSDLASVPVSTLSGFIRHALFLREYSPFCRNIPEDIFLHFVFYPRINSEDLTDCRGFFYEKLSALIPVPDLNGSPQEGSRARLHISPLEEEQICLEVNRWCCENMTYEQSDSRTENPVTAYNCGLGRCGEESTFAVTAFRSIGIPARQIYVPWWAHCDDNHAWVEVYAGGKWHFLGACEPEPVLDKGWFNDASTRAPMAVYRTFFSFTGEGMKDEQRIDSFGCAFIYNVTHHYAEESLLSVHVNRPDQSPCANAQIAVYVVNMSSYARLFKAQTSENGDFSVICGRFTAHIEAYSDYGFAMTDILISGEQTSVCLTLNEELPNELIVSEDYIAPEVSGKTKVNVSRDMKERNDILLCECTKKRTQRINSYYLASSDYYDACGPDWSRIFHLAGANVTELYRFYREAPDRELALSMLNAMASKDYRDTSCEMLLSHLNQALPYRDNPEFIPYICNPRIRYEMITDFRTQIDRFLTKGQKENFRENPYLLYHWIQENYPEGNANYYPTLSMQPGAVLKAGVADQKGRNILFTAIMRTLGIPARINPVNEKAQFFKNASFTDADNRNTKTGTSESCRLNLSIRSETPVKYENSFTLSKWNRNPGFQVLDLSEVKGNEIPVQPDPETASAEILSAKPEYTETEFTYLLPPGFYRLLTANRLPCGDQLCRISYFCLKSNQDFSFRSEIRKASDSQLLCRNLLEHFSLKDIPGKEIRSEDFLGTDRLTLLLYPEIAKEPTEHIFNEMLENKAEIKAALSGVLNIILMRQSMDKPENGTLRNILTSFPEIRICYDEFGPNPNMLARKMFLEPGVWPLLILTDQSHTGYYGTCGYQVGTIPLILKLIHVIK